MWDEQNDSGESTLMSSLGKTKSLTGTVVAWAASFP